MNIKFICNYSDDINDWFKKYHLDTHKIKIDKDNPDYYVIINHPFYNNQKQYYDNKKTIYTHIEPISSRKSWEVWKSQETFLYDNQINLRDWHIDMSAKELLKKKITKDKSKKNVITCVTSDLLLLSGHKLRMNFLKYLDVLPQFDIKPEIYGRIKTGFFNQLKLKNYLGDIEKRESILWNYYYNFMAENSPEVNYFTEKILDPILTETLCFYWGCPNIKNYLHEKSFIQVDLVKPEIGLKTIIDSIKNNEYEKRLKYIKETKKKIIYELNPLTIIQNNLMESI